MEEEAPVAGPDDLAAEVKAKVEATHKAFVHIFLALLQTS